MRVASLSVSAHPLFWVAIRFKKCTTWQEQWVTSGQHGCRSGHNTTDALMRLTAELEQAYLDGVPLYCAAMCLLTWPDTCSKQLDYTKAP